MSSSCLLRLDLERLGRVEEMISFVHFQSSHSTVLMSLLEDLDTMDAPVVEKPVVFRVSEGGWSQNRVGASTCACM